MKLISSSLVTLAGGGYWDDQFPPKILNTLDPCFQFTHCQYNKYLDRVPPDDDQLSVTAAKWTNTTPSSSSSYI